MKLIRILDDMAIDSSSNFILVVVKTTLLLLLIVRERHRNGGVSEVFEVLQELRKFQRKEKTGGSLALLKHEMAEDILARHARHAGPPVGLQILPGGLDVPNVCILRIGALL